MAGDTVDEMLPWADTKMRHIQGRLSRALWCDAFGKSSKKLYVIRNFLWEMMFLLEEGLVSPYEIAEMLSRFIIKIDTPRSEVVIDEAEYEDDEEKAVEEPEEDQMVSLGDGTETVESEPDSKEVEEQEPEEKIEEDEVKIADEMDGLIEDVIGYTEKGYPVASVRAAIQTTGDSGGKARYSRRRWQRDGSARVRSKKLRYARLTTEFYAWIERHAARIEIPVAWLLDVLDLRLEDEVLAKANRRVFWEDVSGFSSC